MKSYRVLLAVSFLLSTTLVHGQALPSTPSAPTLRPGDLVRVEIWREEDLSGEFLVDESGAVTLPMIGELDVSGLPIATLRDTLLVQYRLQLRNPSITITPLRRIYVLGEVNEPGLYTVDPTISLAGAVALAGGANQQGDLGRLRIVRNGQPVVEGVPVESALTSVNVLSGDQIFVERRSWFDRNSTFVVSVLLSVTSIIITLAR